MAFSYRVFAEADSTLPFVSPKGRHGFPHPNGIPNGYHGDFISTNLITVQNLPFSKNDPWLPADLLGTRKTAAEIETYIQLMMPP